MEVSEEDEMSEPTKRLYRSQTNKVLAGICGGFAEYLNLDPVVVRVLWIFLTLFGGSGILLYIISWFVIPLNPTPSAPIGTQAGGAQAARIIGIILVAIGLIVLLDNLEVLHFERWMRRSWEFVIPVVLIATGVLLLTRRKKGDSPGSTRSMSIGGSSEQPEPGQGSPTSPGSQRRLTRSMTDRKLFGVCGGLGDYFAIDPTIIRVLFILFAILSFGFGIVLYIIMLLIMPEERFVRI